MSLQSALARVADLHGALTPATPSPAPATEAVGGQTFANLLQQAGPATAVPPLAPAAAGGGGAGLLAAAQGEVGQAEQPPGSNDSPRIAMYRRSTAGSAVAPWCAYFASWAAREAGMPIGDRGEGLGSVDAIYAWAQRTGRAVPAGSGQRPSPGDLIIWDEHMGIVEGVRPDGSIQTIEGNSSDAVTRRVHPAGDALGFVRMG